MAITKVPLVGMIAEMLAAGMYKVEHALHRLPDLFALLYLRLVFAQIRKRVEVLYKTFGSLPGNLLIVTSLQ